MRAGSGDLPARTSHVDARADPARAPTNLTTDPSRLDRYAIAASHPEQHPVRLRVRLFNAGRGGFSAKGTVILDSSPAADVICVTEAAPTEHTRVLLDAGYLGRFSVVETTQCRQDGSVPAHARGATVSGGVLMLLRNNAAGGAMTLRTVVPIKTRAAKLGDVILAEATYDTRDGRTIAVVVGVVYMQPRSSAHVCADGTCLGDCDRAHPVDAVTTALHDMAAAKQPNRTRTTVCTAALMGDLNTHLGGPTCGDLHTNDASRRRTVLGVLQDGDWVAVNDKPAAEPTTTAWHDMLPTRYSHAANERPATLDYCIVHQDDVAAVDTCAVSASDRANTVSDHRALDTDLLLYGVRPPPVTREEQAARDAVRLLTHTTTRYNVPDADSDDWTPVLETLARTLPDVEAALDAAIQTARPRAWTAHPGGVPFRYGVSANLHASLDGVDALLLRCLDDALRQCSMARLAPTHNKAAATGTLEAAVAHARRSLDAAGTEDERTAAKTLLRTAERKLRAKRRQEVATQRHKNLQATTPALVRQQPKETTRTLVARATDAKSTKEATKPRVQATSFKQAGSTKQAVKVWAATLRAVRNARQRAQPEDALERQYSAILGVHQDRAMQDAWRDTPLNKPVDAQEMLAAVVDCRGDAAAIGPPMAVLQAALRSDSPCAKAMLRLLVKYANAALDGRLQHGRILSIVEFKPFYKGKGDLDDFGSWRSILPGHAVAWALHTLVNKRVQAALEANADAHHRRRHTASDTDDAEPPTLRRHDGTEAQPVPDLVLGFRPARGISDAALLRSEALRFLHADRNLWQAAIFFDISGAFPNTQHAVAGVGLDNHGIVGKPWLYLMNVLRRIAVRVRMGDVQAERTIQLHVGTPEGLPCSPVIFMCAYGGLEKHIDDAAEGAGASTMLGGCHAITLTYADDTRTLLAARDEASLNAQTQAVLDAVADFHQRRGWQLNVKPDGSKTAIQISPPAGVERTQQTAFLLDGRPVPVVEYYRHLGVRVSLQRPGARTHREDQDGRTSIAPLRASTARANVANAGLQRLHTRSATMLYKTAIRPAATFSADIWAAHYVGASGDTYITQDGTLHKMQVHALRAIAGYGQAAATSHVVLQAAFGLPPIWATVLRARVQLYVRFMRRHPADKTRAILAHCTARRNANGRLAKTWVSTLLSDLSAEDDGEGFEYLRQDLVDGRQWPAQPQASDGKRSDTYLLQRVDELQQRERDRRVRDMSSLTDDVLPAILRQPVQRPMPLVDSSLAHKSARVRALGGVCSIAHARRWPDIKPPRACVVCNKHGTTTTLRHVVAHCQAAGLHDARGVAWAAAARRVPPGEDRAEAVARVDDLLRTAPAGNEHDYAVWTAVTLGWTLPPWEGSHDDDPARGWRLDWDRGTQRRKHAAVRAGPSMRQAMLHDTGHLINLAVKAIEEGAYAASSFRTAREQQAAEERTKHRQQNMMRALFSRAPATAVDSPAGAHRHGLRQRADSDTRRAELAAMTKEADAIDDAGRVVMGDAGSTTSGDTADAAVAPHASDRTPTADCDQPPSDGRVGSTHAAERSSAPTTNARRRPVTERFRTLQRRPGGGPQAAPTARPTQRTLTDLFRTMQASDTSQPAGEEARDGHTDEPSTTADAQTARRLGEDPPAAETVAPARTVTEALMGRRRRGAP